MSKVEKISPVFQSTGKENIPLVNVYDKKDLEIKNSLVSKVKGLSSDAVSAIRSNPDLLTKAGGILMAYSQGNYDLSVKGALSLVESTDFGKKVKGIVSGYGDKIKGTLEAGFKNINLDPKKALGVASNIAGVIDFVEGGKGLSDPALGSLLNKVASNISNKPQLINMDWESNVITSTGKLLLDSGGADLLDGLIDDYITDYNSKGSNEVASIIVTRATKNLLPDVVKTGNIKNIEKAIDRLTKSNILEEYPEIKKDILEYYVIPKKTKPDDYSNQRIVLERVLGKIDYNWFRFNSLRVDYRVEDDEVVSFLDARTRFDLLPFVDIGEDARTILATDVSNAYGVALALSKEYDYIELDAKQALSSMFPHLTLTE